MNKLREIRFQKNIPQIRLAFKTKIHFSTLSRIERGWIQATPEQKRKLAKALKVDSHWLFPSEDRQK